MVGLDRTRVTISGSAPLSKDILLFLRCLLKGVVIEGYGATETSGPTTLQVGGDYSIGNVGGALPCCDIKLVHVPEMGYLTMVLLVKDEASCGFGAIISLLDISRLQN